MTVVVELTQTAVAENARTVLDQEEYKKRYDGLVQRYNDTKSQYDSVTDQIAGNRVKQESMTRFLDTLKTQDGVVTDFDEALWSSTVEFITIYSAKDIRITFKGDIEIQI